MGAFRDWEGSGRGGSNGSSESQLQIMEGSLRIPGEAWAGE